MTAFEFIQTQTLCCADSAQRIVFTNSESGEQICSLSHQYSGIHPVQGYSDVNVAKCYYSH